MAQDPKAADTDSAPTTTPMTTQLQNARVLGLEALTETLRAAKRLARNLEPVSASDLQKNAAALAAAAEAAMSLMVVDAQLRQVLES